MVKPGSHMCSIVVICSTVMHAEHSEGSCWPLIPVRRHVEVQKRWLEKEEVVVGGVVGLQTNKQSKKKDPVACKKR